MDAEAGAAGRKTEPAGEGRLRRAARTAITAGFDAGAWITARVRKPPPAGAPPPTSGVAPLGVIAHRGASAYAPENTLVSLRRAVEQDVREVELDVQLSRDDVLMLFHDRDLEPKTGMHGCVRDHDAGALRSLEVGSWFDAEHPEIAERFAGTRLNDLAEVFEAFGDALHYHIEIKSAEAAVPERLLAEIARWGLRDHVTITSFECRPLIHLRELDRALPICQLVRRVERLRDAAMERTLLQDLRPRTLQRHALERAVRLGFFQVAFPAQQLCPEVVARARALGLSIRAWRVRSLDDLDRALRLGLDGVTVDWPDRALARIAAAQLPASS